MQKGSHESESKYIGFPSRRGRFFYGWRVLALGALINAVGMGLLYNSFTIFFLPLKRDFAVSSAAISLLYGASRLEGGFEGPLIGYLIDRFGPRAIILAGATMAGLGLILLSTVNDYWSFFFIYIFIVSLGYNAGFFHPVSTAINNWFIRHRGFGFSVITASGNIGGMILAPLLSFLILTFGWRIGSLAAGILILGVSIPAALPIHRSPEVRGLRPDGDPPKETLSGGPMPIRKEAPELNFSIRAALKTVHYWMLLTTISLRLCVTIALNGHLIPILVWRGMDEATGAYLVSLFAFVSILTSLGMGWLGDRYKKTLLCWVGILPTIAALMGLVVSDSSIVLYSFPIGLAVTMGTAPLNWALIGDFFGRRSYATLRGIMAIGYGVATFISPIYAGWVYDLTGSYAIVLITFAIILGISALVFAGLRPPIEESGVRDGSG